MSKVAEPENLKKLINEVSPLEDMSAFLSHAVSITQKAIIHIFTLELTRGLKIFHN